jgi:uncharacterized SAM-binding protein YcdF (DUF218 family)
MAIVWWFGQQGARLPAGQVENVTDRITTQGRGFVFWQRTLLAGITLMTAVLVAGFIYFLNMIERVERPPTKADAIVALTGGSQRIGDAVSLLASQHGRRLLISGVNEKAGREEILRANPELRPYLDCCVDLDYRARNTIGNAIETRRWARTNGFRSLIVVTSNYHMPRSLMELSHAFPQLQLVPFAVITDPANIDRWWRDPQIARLLVVEYLKYLVGSVRTYLETDPERSRFAVVASGRKPISLLP